MQLPDLADQNSSAKLKEILQHRIEQGGLFHMRGMARAGNDGQLGPGDANPEVIDLWPTIRPVLITPR